MKAARLHAYGQPLVIEDVPTPTPAHGGVVVRVHGAGFCHSDIHVIDGELPILPRMPQILGHENAGVVAAVGAGVTSVREGDPVAVFGGWGCGRCSYCVGGHEQLCEQLEWVGLSRHDGGYAEYLEVPHERYLVPLRSLTPAAAAPLTDAALTPYRAIKKALPYLTPEHPVVLIGLGGLGQYGLKLLRLLTGSQVIVVDTSDAKLRLARTLGASDALSASDPDLQDKLRALTSGGPIATFDFVGSDATLALGLGITRTLGKVTQLGLAGGTARMKVLESTRFEVTFEATLWGTIQELREVIALAEDGRLSLIETEIASLDQINDVYHRVKRGEVAGRVVIRP
jgi:propanol-preferring alcohol dehydrogenase